MIKRILGILLAVVLIGGFGTGGVLTLTGVVRQAQTASWPAAAEAIVIASGVSPHGGSHGTTYAPAVAYRYRVGSTWYDSTTISLGMEVSSSGGGYASAVVGRFPAGSQAIAYVNPANPSQSVLIRGLDDHQYVRIAFATPFLSVSLGLASIIGISLLRRRGWISYVRIFQPAPGIHVARDCGLGPGVSAIGLAMLLGFVTPFPVLFFFERYPVIPMAVLAMGSVSAVVAVYLRQRRRLREGCYDLVIDGNGGLLLPARRSKPAVDPVSLASITSVDVDERTERRRRSTSTSWWVVARTTSNGRSAKLELVQFHLQPEADAFRDWVKERVSEARATGARRGDGALGAFGEGT